jgi:hypothetical protein
MNIPRTADWVSIVAGGLTFVQIGITFVWPAPAPSAGAIDQDPSTTKIAFTILLTIALAVFCFAVQFNVGLRLIKAMGKTGYNMAWMVSLLGLAVFVALEFVALDQLGLTWLWLLLMALPFGLGAAGWVYQEEYFETMFPH